MNIINELNLKRKSIELRSEISVISDYKNMTIIRGLHHSDEVYIEIDEQLNILREELLLMYFPNILSMAKRYKLDMNILFTTGVIALYKALDNFDLSKDVKFSTYLIWHLKNAFRMEYTKLSDIYIPLNFRELLVKYKKVKSSEGFNFDEFVESECKKFPTWDIENTKARLLQYENYNNEEVKDYHDVTEEVEIADDLSGIWIQVERLVGEKYTKIIKMYYEGKSFVEIAEQFGVSKQRVNSMFWNSIKKIQNNKKLFANFV